VKHFFLTALLSAALLAQAQPTPSAPSAPADTASDVELFGRAGPDLSNMSSWVPVTVTFSEGMARNGHFEFLFPDTPECFLL
jgi:hypothetical protein